MLNLTALQTRVWTNYLVDIILLIVLVVFAMICAKKGFIECFFGFVSVIAAFLAAILFSKVLVGALNSWFDLGEVFTNAFQNAFLKIEGFDIDVSVTGLTAALEGKDLPKFLVDLLVENFANESIPEGTTLAFLVGQKLSGLAISAIAFIVLFFAARILMNLLKKVLKLMASKISLLGAVDQLLGAAVGLIEGLLLINALLGLLALIPSNAITGYVNNSIIAGWLYNHNLINIILGWVLG